MENNIYTSVTGATVIINGGNPLPGCPNDWDEAKAIQIKLNEGKQDDEAFGEEPRWKFDCGFKLDFDGPLVNVSSRFYPPKTHYGSSWDGSVTILICDTAITRKEFDCATLEELKKQVEDYVKTVADKIRSINFDL